MKTLVTSRNVFHKGLTTIILFVAGIGISAAQTVNLTAVPDSPTGPTRVTVTWSSTGATSCTASGAWSGAKALTGSQVFTAVKETQTYTLTCSAGSGQATVSWTAPTTWVDLDPLPPNEPGSYEVFHHTTTAVELGTKATVPAPAGSYVFTNLPAGLRYFAVKAVSTQAVASDLSEIKSKDIVLPSATATATATVRRKPGPPNNISVSSP